MSVKQILLWFLGQASIGLLKPYEVENVKLNIYKMCKQCSLFLPYHVAQKLRIVNSNMVSVSKIY